MNLIGVFPPVFRKEPLIVIDLLTVVSSLSGPSCEQIFGCRNQFARKYANQFCDRMIEAGARLAFFIDGMLQVGKYDHWIRKQEQAYANCLKRVENIRIGPRGNIEGGLQGNVVKHAFTSALVEAARKKGTLIATYDVECDQELATFARKHDALAIITSDSDFLIFEGNFRLWSSADLNRRSMQTKEWHREKLRSNLNLEWCHMSFFAAIAGNDQFKHRPSILRSLPEVAQKVRELDLRYGHTELSIDLYEKIFNHRDANSWNSFEKTVKTYDTTYAVLKPIVPLEMRHFPNYAVSIIRDIPRSIRLPCLDLREAEYSQIALQLYRRHVGVLFRHRVAVDGKALLSRVFIKPNHYEVYRIIETTPITPPLAVKVPLPEELYSLDSQVSKSLEEVKYRLLTWLVSDTLTFEEVRDINRQYLLDVLTLYFLVEKNLLDHTTADIILVTIDDCVNNRIPYNTPLERPRRPNVTTSFKYSNFYALMYFSAETAGLRHELNHTFQCKFDGVYFNQIVDNLRVDADLLTTKLEPIKSYRVYAKLANRNLVTVEPEENSVGMVPTVKAERPQLSDIYEEPSKKISR